MQHDCVQKNHALSCHPILKIPYLCTNPKNMVVGTAKQDKRKVIFPLYFCIFIFIFL